MTNSILCTVVDSGLMRSAMFLALHRSVSLFKHDLELKSKLSALWLCLTVDIYVTYNREDASQPDLCLLLCWVHESAIAKTSCTEASSCGSVYHITAIHSRSSRGSFS
jgi:hypothetical protein